MLKKNVAALRENDPEIYAAITAEDARQEAHIELIASENYASSAILEATGSSLTNKYAEGYPGARYYGGCEHVDTVERIAIARAKALFKVGYVNVQPHSGSSANMAVFLGLLQPGDTILGMGLDHGGHLTHGAKVSFSGRVFNALQYGLDNSTGDIDYAEVEALAIAHKPKLIIAGFSAYSGLIDWARFRVIADKVGAYVLADIAHVAGLVAAGVYPSPVDYADVITSTTHKTLRGPRSGIIMAKTDVLAKQLNFAIFPMLQGGPLLHIIAAKAIAFQEAMQPDFVAYQQQVVKNAQLFAETLAKSGFTVISGGTYNHMFLVDVTAQNVTGKEAEALLERVGITVNKNSIPGDTRSPFVTSGIRIGTPAITTRGFGSTEVVQVAQWIVEVLQNKENQQVQDKIMIAVADLCKRFPVYQ